jgi:hypothetical protein
VKKSFAEWFALRDAADLSLYRDVDSPMYGRAWVEPPVAGQSDVADYCAFLGWITAQGWVAFIHDNGELVVLGRDPGVTEEIVLPRESLIEIGEKWGDGFDVVYPTLGRIMKWSSAAVDRLVAEAFRLYESSGY